MRKEEIEAAKTSNGGYTKAQLAQWGVPWPPPKGWKHGLINQSLSSHILLDYANLTWMQMSDIVYLIWEEMKRRNPIGINLYAPVVHEAASALDEISEGESENFTSESGPKEPKREKGAESV